MPTAYLLVKSAIESILHYEIDLLNLLKISMNLGWIESEPVILLCFDWNLSNRFNDYFSDLFFET